MKHKDDVGCGGARPAGLRSHVFELMPESASNEVEKDEVSAGDGLELGACFICAA